MRSKKVFYNISTNLVLQLVTIIYGFIVPKIIISNYGSEVNGLISSITQFLAYITLLESGFGPVVKSILYKPIAKNDKEKIANILKSSEKFFKNISKIFIVYIIVLSVLYPTLVNNEFSNLYTISLILIISISTFSEYYFGMTYRLYLQAEQKTYIISIIQIVTYLLAIIFVVIASIFSISVQLMKLGTALIFVFRPILQNKYVKKKYNINLKNANGDYKIKNKWDGLVQHIAAVIHGNTDVTILTIFSTLSEVSVYSVYYLVVKGVKTLVQSLLNGMDATFGDMIVKHEYKNLNNKFETYEWFYFSVTTIIFSCAMILIVPFVSIYTKGITDANYIRYAFGYLLVISEYICMIRMPYISLSHAAGHFKETRKGAVIECITNLVLSVILVFNFGIIGVTIGTIVAMAIRMCEFVYHASTYILKRSIWISVKKITIVFIETILIILIFKFVPVLEYTNYFNWIINAVIIGAISTGIVITINSLFFPGEFRNLINIIKSVLGKNIEK